MVWIENNKHPQCHSHWCQKGQAMSEFVILLTVLMVMAAGMIYISRLLTFQYFAREEARFITFQQTWSAKMGEVVPGTVSMNTADKGAPEYVRKTVPNRSSLVEGNLQSIIARNNISQNGNTINTAMPEDQIFLASAKNSIWDRKTSEWYDDFKNSLISNAYARSREITPSDSWETANRRESELELGFIAILEEGEFGEKFCQSMVQIISSYGLKAEMTPFAGKYCTKDYNTLFGLHLARNVDFRNLFAHYGKLLEAKKSPEQALQMLGTREIRNQFYSLFDKKIKNTMKNAMSFLIEGAETSDILIAGDFSGLLLKAKYKGGRNAVQAIFNFIDPIHNNSSLRKVDVELQREVIRNRILHADVFTDPLWGKKSFNISNEFSPIPADFTKAQAALFDGVMKNVLTKEPGLVNLWINNTNIETNISYPPQQGIFPFLVGRFAMAKKPLSAKYFLFDQPWFISRQIPQRVYGRPYRFCRGFLGSFLCRFYRSTSYTYGYRALGSEDDLMTSESEEGLLRRRTYGLWLVPSDAQAMFSPLTKLAGSGAANAFDAGSAVLNAPGFVKDQLSTFLNGEGLPMLSSLVDAVNSIPEIFGFDFTPPVLPAVRPQAYPNSKEIEGDNLMGSGTNRTMSDYRSEQISNINNNP